VPAAAFQYLVIAKKKLLKIGKPGANKVLAKKLKILYNKHSLNKPQTKRILPWATKNN